MHPDGLPIDPDLDAADPSAPAATHHAAPPGARPHRRDPRTLAVIAAGGAIGTLARYGVTRAVAWSPPRFPLATLLVNVAGSFALGAVLVVALEHRRGGRHLRAFAGTGVIGALTTFSTFVVDADLLVRAGRVAVAAAYVGASLAAGLIAVSLGIGVTRRLLGPAPARP